MKVLMKHKDIKIEDKALVLSKLRQLKRLYDEGEIPKLKHHEVFPDVDKNSTKKYMYITLISSINFQRSSPALWTSAYKTYQDVNTKLVFDPEYVAKSEFEDLQIKLTKYNLALQKNKHVKIWQTICKSLVNNFNGDPKNLISSNQRCVSRIKNYLLENKNSYPYLNGPKLSNYWLYTLDHFTDVNLRNRHKISIIPDTHVKKASVKLGLTNSQDTSVIESVWFHVLKDTEYIPIDFHAILWNWSRAGFKPEV